MTHLSITPEEATVLRELLQIALVELRHEIWHTDAREFRQGLLDRQHTIEHLLAEIGEHERVLLPS